MSRYDMKFARRVSLLHVLSSLELAFAFSLEPTSARRRASPRTRAPVLDQVPAAIALGTFPRVLVPWAPSLMRPMQHLKVASLRRSLARLRVPRAPVLTRPLHHLQVASLRRVRARHRVPRATVLMRPLQDLQVPSPRRR